MSHNEETAYVPLTTGQRVWLGTQIASNSLTINFNNLITSTYDVFEVELYGVQPNTNNTTLCMRVGTGVTPTYDSGANYDTGGAYWKTSSGSTFVQNLAAETQMQITAFNVAGNASVASCNGKIAMYNLNSTSLVKTVNTSINSFNATTVGQVAFLTHDWRTSGTAVSSIQFFMLSGNVLIGNFKLYGIVN